MWSLFDVLFLQFYSLQCLLEEERALMPGHRQKPVICLYTIDTPTTRLIILIYITVLLRAQDLYITHQEF